MSIESDLQKSMAEELKARDDYRSRGSTAGSHGDKDTAQLYEHIAGEEQAHHDEFQQRLSEKEGKGGGEMSGQSCSCNSLQAILQKSKYRTGEIDVVYKDPKYDVYSYEYGDGIWGTSIDLCDEASYEKALKEFGKEAIEKAELGEEVPVCVPISDVTNKYSILNKRGDVILPAERDLSHMCFSGSITLPDGEVVEPDSPRSPLRKMGLI